ncbi:MAG: helix-turn-helix domain-containing protein [Nitrospira sp.]|nr:helix-turn-helix domain-containing protein [Nitrospira sp.]
MPHVKSASKRPRRPLGPPIQFHDLPDWVPPAQAAQFLRSGLVTVYDLCRKGTLPSRRFGRLVRIPKESLRPTVTGPEAK